MVDVAAGAAAAAAAAATAAVGKPQPTVAQLALLIMWVLGLSLWVLVEFASYKRRAYTHLGSSEVEMQAAGDDKPTETKLPNWRDPVRVLEVLRACALFGLIMVFFYFCDYYKGLPPGERTYNRDLFLFILLVILLGGLYTTQVSDKDVHLNRCQTEEWKGWMQVMFVLYHYFKAAETYNAIRCFIAAYVWMTGFGNFIYFQKSNDFSVVRLLRMLFRLNFLVTFICWVVNTEYMLYYICPMHTFWFLVVYFFMLILNSKNNEPKWMYGKFAALFVTIFLLWDVSGFGEIVFGLFYPILGYEGTMHEWMFRSGLDHYATFFGMLTAYHFEYFKRLTDMMRGNMARIACVAVCGLVLYGWYMLFYIRPKIDYNAIHPYTSVIPITVYITLRNMTPYLRHRHMELFAWLGRITLETYLSQLHIWLQANAKELIVYIPGYPLINFALATAVYVYISYILFHLTNTFSGFLLPNDMKQIFAYTGVLGAVLAASLGMALMVRPLIV